MSYDFIFHIWINLDILLILIVFSPQNHDGHLVARLDDLGAPGPTRRFPKTSKAGNQARSTESTVVFFFVESSMFAWSAYFNNNTTFCLKLSKPSSFEIFVYYEHNFIRHLQMLGVRNGENVAKPHILSAFIFVISHAIVLMSKMLSNATKLR